MVDDPNVQLQLDVDEEANRAYLRWWLQDWEKKRLNTWHQDLVKQPDGTILWETIPPISLQEEE